MVVGDFPGVLFDYYLMRDGDGGCRLGSLEVVSFNIDGIYSSMLVSSPIRDIRQIL